MLLDTSVSYYAYRNHQRCGSVTFWYGSGSKGGSFSPKIESANPAQLS